MVTGLSVRDAVVRFGSLTAVDGANLDVPAGHVLGLLGPSGSGKSSLLRAIAGLEPLACGRVLWDGEDLSRIRVHKRNIGFVFQDAQLFPNYDVAGNVGYGLGKLSKFARSTRVAEMLELVGLGGYESRRVTELSGGQAQRVALARSLAPEPRALLLDEPFSALDRGLREHLAGELARILREVGITAVHVTHDQDEASTVADTVAVLDAGKVLQTATPDVLWNRPASTRVARFLGFTAFLDGDEARTLGWTGDLPNGTVLGVGPRSLQLDPAGARLAVVDQGYDLGHVEVGVRLPRGQRALVLSPERITGDEVGVRLIGGAVTPEDARQG